MIFFAFFSINFRYCLPLQKQKGWHHIKIYACCHNYCHRSLSFFKMQQKSCMWNRILKCGSLPRHPIVLSVRLKMKQRDSTGSWLKIWLPKVTNKMFNGMSFSNGNVWIIHNRDILILTYSELCTVSANFLIDVKN